MAVNRKKLEGTVMLLVSITGFVFFFEVMLSNFLAEELEIEGVVKEFSCSFTDKSKLNNTFKFELENGKIFHNNNNGSCDRLNWIRPGTNIKLIVRNKRIYQAQINGREYFNYEDTKENFKKNTLMYAFLSLAFFLMTIVAYLKAYKGLSWKD